MKVKQLRTFCFVVDLSCTDILKFSGFVHFLRVGRGVSIKSNRLNYEYKVWKRQEGVRSSQIAFAPVAMYFVADVRIVSVYLVLVRLDAVDLRAAAQFVP